MKTPQENPKKSLHKNVLTQPLAIWRKGFLELSSRFYRNTYMHIKPMLNTKASWTRRDREQRGITDNRREFVTSTDSEEIEATR